MHIESISQRILPLITGTSFRATVASVFAEACNLVTDTGDFISLVTPQIGNGPLNALINRPLGLPPLEQGDGVTGNGEWLRLGSGWRLSLTKACSWNPMPDYNQLALRPAVVRGNLAWLNTNLPLEAPPASLAAAPAYHTQGAFGSRPAIALIQSQARELTDGLLQAYQKANLQWVSIYARRLAGLGPGLTPAGDDWMAGWLIGLRAQSALTAPAAVRPPIALSAVADAIVRAASNHTSPLSLALLRAAADGQVPQAWHDLIDNLVNADPITIQEAASSIIRQGATSGADSLAGFLASFDRLD